MLAVLIACEPGRGQDIDYARDVKPIFRERCFACHAALKQESGLRLDTAAAIRKGGEGGRVVEPKNAAASVLIELVTAKDADERMPPEGKPLTVSQIKILKAWIDQGATGPADENPEEDPRAHWAFRLPVKASFAPRKRALTRSDRRLNPIDAFIAAEREKRNLKPVATVDKRLLLRRVYLDLIGLPPTREELHAFLTDTRPDAFERVVDRLLASPHYGERWGRHWMDIWRYTDWYGLGKQLRYSQKHIWHWRDWIVESLNDDKGYDRMVMEMLAADEIAPTDRDALRATGFLARNYFLFNRTTWLDNTIEHTSKALLGLTMNCCKCHDHKYDPLAQTDYYRMRAIFEPHQVRLDTLPGESDLEKNGLPRVFDAHPDAPTYLHIRGNAKDLDKRRKIVPGVPAILASEPVKISPVELPPEAHRPELRSFVLEDHLRQADVAIQQARSALEEAQKQLALAKKTSSQKVEEVGTESDPSGKIIIFDKFDAENSAHWQTGPGKWAWNNGKLLQSQVGANRAWLRTQKNHPRDFHARLRFKTTGGEMWKSVGLAFDVAGDREKLVYLSAVQPGSKLQVSYKTGANHTYPVNGKRDRPVSVNKVYDLKIDVRGTLVNVSVDRHHVLAYRLPVKREPGRLDLVAFDAAVEFDEIEIAELAAEFKLVEPGKPGQPAAPTSEVAQATVNTADKHLAAQLIRPEVLRAAHAADLAKCQSAPLENSNEIVTAAAAAARKLEVAQAEHAVARAEESLVKANDDAKKKAAAAEIKKAKAKLDQSRKALDKPGKKYTSLTASLKALEGPDETATSRSVPYPSVSTGRRTALARWITDRQNPLTARVAVNHIWLRHFGQPLVDPVTDFGRRTKPPPQQDLLDWLAVEFMESGWQTKRLHRLMVTSETYKLSSSTLGADETTAQVDQDNHFYWRRKPVRMQSQVLRDSLLHLAGTLRMQIGGPTIDPKKDDTVFRRSMYFTHSRDDLNKFLSMFDDADILRCYRRSESIVPQQALTLANSKLAMTMARRLATRLTQQFAKIDDDQFITAAFETVMCVQPTTEERELCRSALALTTALLVEKQHPQPEARARENLVHALLNHNDFITVR